MRETMLKVIPMFTGLGRLLLAGWFIGMIGLTIWNGRGVGAQGGGSERLYLPIVQNAYDWGIRDYMGLVNTPNGYFTVRGDSSQWNALTPEASSFGSWSPNGANFIYTFDEQVWLVPLDTREPQLITDGRAEAATWSPDSRYVAYRSTVGNAVHILDSDTLEFLIVPVNGTALVFQWSANSTALAWTGRDATTATDLWVWASREPSARRVTFDTEGYGYEMFWAPDGSKLLFNHWLSPFHTGIFVTTVAGETPTLISDSATMHGWVEGGARILMQHSGNLYLALPDTTSQTLLFAGVGDYPRPVIAPDGERVLFNDSNGRQHIQATTATTASPVEFGDCYDVNQWQKNGTRVSCSASKGDYGQYLGLKVGDGTANPVTPQYELYQYIYPQFLEGPTPYMGTAHYTLRFAPLGYPVLDDYDGSFLFNLQTGGLKQISYPGDMMWRVLEWRYMP